MEESQKIIVPLSDNVTLITEENPDLNLYKDIYNEDGTQKFNLDIKEIKEMYQLTYYAKA